MKGTQSGLADYVIGQSGRIEVRHHRAYSDYGDAPLGRDGPVQNCTSGIHWPQEIDRDGSHELVVGEIRKSQSVDCCCGAVN